MKQEVRDKHQRFGSFPIPVIRCDTKRAVKCIHQYTSCCVGEFDFECNSFFGLYPSMYEWLDEIACSNTAQLVCCSV